MAVQGLNRVQLATLVETCQGRMGRLKKANCPVGRVVKAPSMAVQGLNRVQQAPSVSKAMHAILWRCQQRLGQWVGSSVIHLGDHNVPNALMFIDKYTQVPRILNPVVLVLDSLPQHCRDPHLRDYVHSVFGSVEGCRKAIALDFFRHAFDGSGADNFFDAGSCIDGRLTSAWNWGSKIEKKNYYPIFKVAGFVGFDGEFKG